MKKYALLFALALMAVLAFSTTTSPIYSGQEGFDSAIFKTVGLAVLEGKTPYVDIFDHKGPVLYFINALGQALIPGSLGIFFLQIWSLFAAFVFIYQSARLFVGPLLSGLVTVLCVLLLFVTMQGGNLCEEWELLAVAPALYACLLYQRSDLSPRRTFRTGLILGAAFAFCFFIRPNDAVSLPGGMAFGLFLFLLIEKQFRALLPYLFSFLLGLAAVTLPILWYFASRGALDGLYYGLIGHNLLYSGGLFSAEGMAERLVLLAFCLLTFFLLHKTKRRNLSLLVGPVLLLFTLLVGKNFFAHYLTVLIPIVLLCAAVLFSTRRVWEYASYLAAAVVMVCVSFLYVDTLHLRLRNHAQYDCYKESRRMLGRIPEEERSQIWNFNLGFASDGFQYVSVFCHNRLVPMNRILLYNMVFIDPSLARSEDVAQSKPLWVLLTHADDTLAYPQGKSSGQLYEFFQPGYDFIEANYERVDCADATLCDLELWRRKDREPPIIIEDIQ